MKTYRKRSPIVKAAQIDSIIEIRKPTLGLIRGYPGDWIIIDIKGEESFCSNEAFTELYEEIESADPSN